MRKLIEYINILLANGWTKVTVWKKGAVLKETAKEAFEFEEQLGKKTTLHTKHHD